MNTIHRFDVLKKIEEVSLGNLQTHQILFVNGKGGLTKKLQCRKHICSYDTKKSMSKVRIEASNRDKRKLYDLHSLDAILMYDEMVQRPFTLLIDMIVRFNNQQVVY